MSLGLIAFIALAPFLWALVNHTDKYLVSRYFKGGGIGGLMIFSTFFSILTLPVILFFDHRAYAVNPSSIGVLLVAGMLNATAIWLYLKALDHDETSIVVPFMQLVPIFSFIFGYLLLGETLTLTQITAGLIIIFGASLLTIKIKLGVKVKLDFKVFMLMTGHCLLYAIYGVLFKFVGLEFGFWSAAFWESIGLILTGLVFFAVPAYRAEFFGVIKENSKAILGVNLLSEVLTIAGNWITTSASLLAPVALVSLVAGLQPLFVFIIGIIITLTLPQLGKEEITKRSLIQKIASIGIITFGTYLLYY